MSTEYNKELLDIMIDNIEESKFIANNYENELNKLRENFRNDLIKEIKKKLSVDNYTVKKGKPTSNIFSQIWIHLNNRPEPPFYIGVESFSGRGNNNGDMYVGIFCNNNSQIIANLPEENRLNKMWKQVRFIETEAGNNINLSHNYTIKILNDRDSTKYKELLETCCDQTVAFIEEYQEKLPKELFESTLVENK